MPDGDYLAWRAGGKWRLLANLVRTGASSTELEDALASAVANSIRATGGIPEFDQLADGVHRAANDGTEAFAVPPSAPRDGVLRRLLHEVAPTLTIAMHRDLQLSSPITATELLAERFLSRVAGAGLDHMLPTLVADGSYTMLQLRDLFTRLSSSAPMADLRDRFIRHPSGNGLRTPNRRTAVRPLRELVDTGLEAL